MTTSVLSELEAAIGNTGRECFEEIRSMKMSFMDPKAYTSKLMSWAMEDPEFRVALFRFVDVLPGLKDSTSVIDHAQAYFSPHSSHVGRDALLGVRQGRDHRAGLHPGGW